MNVIRVIKQLFVIVLIVLVHFQSMVLCFLTFASLPLFKMRFLYVQEMYSTLNTVVVCDFALVSLDVVLCRCQTFYCKAELCMVGHVVC